MVKKRTENFQEMGTLPKGKQTKIGLRLDKKDGDAC